MKSSVVPDVRKIAVLRANALGDLIYTLPSLEALKAAYPQAELVLLAKPWHKAFLTGRPGPVDRVIVVPPSRGVREEPEMAENQVELQDFFGAMRGERFDLALQMHGGGRNSNPFILKLGARLTVGLKTPDAPPLNRWVPYIYYQHEVMRFLEVAALVGATAIRLHPTVAVTNADLAEAERVVPSGSETLVVMHSGASSVRRHWPVERFAAVGDALAARGARILLTGIESDRPMIEGVMAQMTHQAENLCARLSLGGLAGLLSRAALMISNDTGPLHLAEAVGTSTVGIYWCGNLINWSPTTRRQHRPTLSWVVTCPRCGMPTEYFNTDRDHNGCDHEVSFVTGVSQETVIGSALELLSQEAGTDSYDH